VVNVIRKSMPILILLVSAFSSSTRAQTPDSSKSSPPTGGDQNSAAKSGAPDTLEKRVEVYLRNLYAWGPEFSVKVDAPKPSPISDLLEVPVTISKDEQSSSAVVYVSKSGKYMIRGELTDMTIDPFADVAAKLHVGDSPSKGPANAKVTVIEFADFECPVCRQLDLILRDLLPKHPEIRFVFKQFPLTEIHPWAMTAAIATQCAWAQNPDAFWKMHDAVYDAQDSITPENAWDKLLEIATQSGLNPDGYKTCIASPDTANQVKSTIEEGRALDVNATPTTFINNRRIVGPDKSTIERAVVFNII
jgi:protein-disulfide isomerase